MTKCRDTNIPSKKRLGEVKEEIMLADDEYIGESVSILFDKRVSVMMVQSNIYGLTMKQIENYLTELRLRYIDKTNKTETEPLLVRLRPIVDLNKVDKAIAKELILSWLYR